MSPAVYEGKMPTTHGESPAQDADFKVTSGRHLAVMREFIKCRALNGDTVTWGSTDHVRLADVTVDDLERLAERIKRVCQPGNDK